VSEKKANRGRKNTDACHRDEADVLLDARGKENDTLMSKNALVSGKKTDYIFDVDDMVLNALL
jgi:hypothetical protein